MMRAFQERGHQVQFLIGDFTTRIGDPTGRSRTRTVPSPDEIERNAEDFVRQAGQVLITDDPRLFQVRRNSEWYDRMPAAELLGLLSQVTLGRLSSRDMFRERVAREEQIWAHGLVYPVLQGWDSVMLESDLTIVGSDQLINEMMGRFFQEKRRQRPQVIITSRITPGLDGVQKQSKSLDNYVALDDPPREKSGKVMSLPDALVPEWMEVYTGLPLQEIGQLKSDLAVGRAHPREAKLELAEAIVSLHHGPSAAKAERGWFAQTFSQGSLPADAPLVALDGPLTAIDLVARAFGVEPTV
jgi:tyrosyl-tRNA synthetase